MTLLTLICIGKKYVSKKSLFALFITLRFYKITVKRGCRITACAAKTTAQAFYHEIQVEQHVLSLLGFI